MAGEADQKKPSGDAQESFQLPGPLCAAVGFAMLAVVMYWNNLPGASQELFAPHVVPPPPGAKQNEVVVQFCQN